MPSLLAGGSRRMKKFGVESVLSYHSPTLLPPVSISSLLLHCFLHLPDHHTVVVALRVLPLAQLPIPPWPLPSFFTPLNAYPPSGGGNSSFLLFLPELLPTAFLITTASSTFWSLPAFVCLSSACPLLLFRNPIYTLHYVDLLISTIRIRLKVYEYNTLLKS